MVRMTATEPAIAVLPANEASCEDLQAVFGTPTTGTGVAADRRGLRRV
jgi:hypothetical protein